MNLRPDLQLQTAIRALNDVVLPALNRDNKLAVEQASLVIGMLTLMQRTLPLAYRYEHDELRRNSALAGRLCAEAAGETECAEVVESLAAGAATAADVLARAGADPQELVDANDLLRDRIGALVSVACRDGRRPRSAVARALLASSREQNLRERAWFVSQGWESDPASIPALESLV